MCDTLLFFLIDMLHSSILTIKLLYIIFDQKF